MGSEGLGQVVSWYICTVVAFAFVGLRLVVKWKNFGRLIIDDFLIILAACCLLGDLIIQHYMWIQGMANIGGASSDQFIRIMKMIVPGSILYVTSLWAIKLAMVLFYKKLAAPKSLLQKVYNVLLGVMLANWAVIFFHIIFQCFPHDKRWSQKPDYQCNPKSAEINYWITILTNIISDCLIISLPISMVMKLQMKLKQKLAVGGIFALGIFVVIASIIRAYYSKKNETMLTCTVSMVETAVAIIATSLPALRQLFLGQTSRKGTGYSDSAGRHYELSSVNKSKGLHSRNNMASVVGGGTSKANDSEDELVKEIGGISGGVSDEKGADGHHIRVNTTYQVFEEDIETGRTAPR